MEPVLRSLKSDSDWKNQNLWLSSGFQKVQEQTQMIFAWAISVRYFSYSPCLWLLLFFIQLLCNALMLSSNFHAGEEMAFVTGLILHLFFVAVYLKIDFRFQWSRRGEVISALYSQEGGNAVWMDLVWSRVLFIRLSFNLVSICFIFSNNNPKILSSMIILLFYLRSLVKPSLPQLEDFLLVLRLLKEDFFFMLPVYIWANLLVCFYLESFC